MSHHGEVTDAGRLLIVDDEADVCSALRRSLRRDGYEIYSALNAEDAIEVLERQPVDVILTDERMPGLRGSQLCALLAEKHPRTIRLILSGHSEIADVVTAMNQGHIYKFLSKPWNDELLRANLREAFARSVELQRADLELERARFFDRETGIPNLESLRRSFTEFQQQFGQAPEGAWILGLCVDQYRALVAANGIEWGGKLMSAIAERLLLLVGAGDLLARVAPEEFMLANIGGQSARSAEECFARLQKMFGDAIDVEGAPAFVSFSCGAAFSGSERSPLSVLYTRAGVAMQAARSRGGNRLEYYGEADVGTEQRHELITRELRSAGSRDQMSIWFQPQVRIQDGATVGVEALLRWTHPILGPIAPSSFIEIAEETGSIRSLDAWSLEHALETFACWREESGIRLRLSLNVSALHLQTADYASLVQASVSRLRVDPQDLTVEVSESVLWQSDGRTLRNLHALRAMGIALSLDDFGTGVASMSALAQSEIEIDEIKIDRCFVRNLRDNRKARAMLEAIVRLARGMGVRTVTKGVETLHELFIAREYGCQVVQGWIYSEAVPVSRLAQVVCNAPTLGSALPMPRELS